MKFRTLALCILVTSSFPLLATESDMDYENPFEEAKDQEPKQAYDQDQEQVEAPKKEVKKEAKIAPKAPSSEEEEFDNYEDDYQP